jgi:uncharacterized protein YjiS (DUF1127 family)
MHHSDELRGAVETAEFLFGFLPPYSPTLKLIKEVIDDMKWEVRRLSSTTLWARVVKIQALHWGEKTRARRALLRMALAEAMRAVTIPPRALNREPVQNKSFNPPKCVPVMGLFREYRFGECNSF